MSVDFWLGLGVAVAVFVINAIVRHDAPQRHARYKMRARLARLFYEGRLKPVSLSRSSNRGPTKRRKVLRVVRRDDSGTGAA